MQSTGFQITRTLHFVLCASYFALRTFHFALRLALRTFQFALRGSAQLPWSAIRTSTTMRASITSPATFHQLTGYVPSICPV